MKRKSKLSLIILVLGILLIIVGIIFIFINTTKIDSSNNNDEDNININDYNTKEISLEDEQCVENICLYKMGFSYNNNVQIVSFNIINKGSTDITINTITITGYNDQKEVVETFEIPSNATYNPNQEDLVYIQYIDKNVKEISSYTFTYN